jgi:hypothetical protein
MDYNRFDYGVPNPSKHFCISDKLVLGSPRIWSAAYLQEMRFTKKVTFQGQYYDSREVRRNAGQRVPAFIHSLRISNLATQLSGHILQCWNRREFGDLRLQ